MKHILITTIAAVLLVGCGNPAADRELLDVAEIGNIEAVKQQLAAGADVNAKEDVDRATPLHKAAEGGHNEIVELLIAKGAVVNAMDGYGKTPLDMVTLRVAWEHSGELIVDIAEGKTATAELLRNKHGGKTGKELRMADDTIPLLNPTKPVPR